MAPFRRDRDELARLDWRILLNGPISLYFRQEILAGDIEWFRRNGYRVFAFDCTRWNSEEAFHLDNKQTLSFPDGYGKNLSAFKDSLSDIDIPETGGCVLQFTRYDLFAERMPAVAQAVLDIIGTTSRLFLLTGQRLVAAVQSDDPEISFAPVGACPVSWNPKEWLNSKRGVKNSLRDNRV